LLGAKDFIDDIRQKYYDKTNIKEVPQVKELFLDKCQIEKAVCGVYQIEVADLLKPRRGNYNEARNVAIYLIRKYAGALNKQKNKNKMARRKKKSTTASAGYIGIIISQNFHKYSGERDLY